MILTEPRVEVGAFEARTGWAIKPEGACAGEVCVPLPEGARTDDMLDAQVLSQRLGMPLLHDDDNDVWCLGPASATGKALVGAEFPALVLPDVRTGEPFDFASLRGQKFLLLAWASW